MAKAPGRKQGSKGWKLDLGATALDPNTTQYRVWAPNAKKMAVRIVEPTPRSISLIQQDCGYWETTIKAGGHGTFYTYLIDDNLERPDPASRFQERGVHGPSTVIDATTYHWNDTNWTGLPLDQFIIYELHVGTFTSEGTFDAIIAKLPYLRDQLGITAIELLPVAQCPGTRNWGYDGVYLFAPQANFGGPDGLKGLVDACHTHGLAVIMDVVYNHFGPEGNYLGNFGRYFTHRYPTPWGQAINYDGPESDAVRHFITSNALYWVTEYHIDALRLDAIHGIFDFSAQHILRDIGESVHEVATQLGRHIHVIAESDLNDVRVIAPINKGGHGLDAQWSDDFHHSLHCVLTGENKGYYEDFGTLKYLATAIEERFVYSNQYSTHRKRQHGNSAKVGAPTQFVIYSQNHDQVGNRAQGDRLSTLLSFNALKVTAATVLLSPNIPLLFMGEEYGETAPFLYFIDHGDPGLIEAVRQGRKADFAAFGWSDVPDPYAQETYDRSHLQWDKPHSQEQTYLLNWYQELIKLRKTIPALGPGKKSDKLKVQTHAKAQVLTIHRTGHSGPAALMILSFNKNATTITLKKPVGKWQMMLDSYSPELGGNNDTSAPQDLTLPSENSSLDLPPYAVWVYTN